jgi:hypothetical protein
LLFVEKLKHIDVPLAACEKDCIGRRPNIVVHAINVVATCTSAEAIDTDELIRLNTYEYPGKLFILLSKIPAGLSKIRTKDQYWRSKLDQASQSKDVFAMSKWHKSTDSFQTPPLKDPLSPDLPTATALPAKRAVLARNLLQNQAEAGDIPLDTPAVSQTALPFPEITITDIVYFRQTERNPPL